MLFPWGDPFKCHEEVLHLKLLIPPKRFDIFPSPEGLGAFWFLFKYLLCKFSVPRGGVEKTVNEKQKNRKTETQTKVRMATSKPLYSRIKLYAQKTLSSKLFKRA